MGVCEVCERKIRSSKLETRNKSEIPNSKVAIGCRGSRIEHPASRITFPVWRFDLLCFVHSALGLWADEQADAGHDSVRAPAPGLLASSSSSLFNSQLSTINYHHSPHRESAFLRSVY